MSAKRRSTFGIHRRLRFESLEDRRVLSTMADIVFLVDESSSGAQTSTQEWLRRLVTGDMDGNNTKDEPSLLDQLSAIGIDDVRFGLVGFGQRNALGVDRFAHSQLFPPFDSNSLTGNPIQLSTAQLNAVFGGLVENGGKEDGLDATDHAIAEYDFRDGAVPLFVLVQNEEGRVNLNTTLTRDGILASLTSKNVILNSMVVGDNVLDGGGNALFDWKPLFDLSPYEALAGAFSNLRVLGVEADAADNLVDGQHDYYLIQTGNGQDATKPATEADTLQVSYNGSNTGATGMVATGKSVLIGQNISGGIGDSNVTAGEFNYHAKSVPFATVKLTAGTVGRRRYFDLAA